MVIAIEMPERFESMYFRGKEKVRSKNECGKLEEISLFAAVG
jgi:hypothetical protein